jgi:lipopolysaccharide transport protein LptA
MRRLVSILLYTAVAAQSLALEAPDISAGDTIVIRAEKAWETRNNEGRALHFEGRFRLLAPDWFVESADAVLYGDVDDPNRIEVAGTPARLWMVDANGATEIDATARNITYFRRSNRLLLEGDALLREGTNSMRSSSIDYDLKDARLLATGVGGVEIVATPKRNGPKRDGPKGDDLSNQPITTGPAND